MITDADFSRIRVFRDLVLGKTSRIGMQKNGGKLEFLTRRGMWRLFNQARGAYLTLDAAYTLKEEDNGKVVMFSSATGFDVTLPDVSLSGWSFRFLVSTQPTSGNHGILSGTADVIFGPISDLAGTGDAASAADRINFVASQAAVGDYVDVSNPGNIVWFANGQAAVAAGVTATG